jgi:hypothetical protein
MPIQLIVLSDSAPRMAAKVIWSLSCSSFFRSSETCQIDKEITMKGKVKVFVLSTVGVAAGLVYAFESNRRKQATANRESPGDIESSANATASAISGGNSADSAEPGASMARTENGKPTAIEIEAHQLDDHGTDQAAASHILQEIRDTAFEGSNEKLALALGRPTEEIEQWSNEGGMIDGDVVMKARALAMQRGVEVE